MKKEESIQCAIQIIKKQDFNDMAMLCLHIPQNSPLSMDAIEKLRKDIPPHVAFWVLHGDAKWQAIDEKAMNQNGWYRKK